MKKIIYDDKKYFIQDISTMYISSGYTLEDICRDEDIPFKFKSFVSKYLSDRYDPEDSLESILYYLEPGGFLPQVFKQLKTKVRVNVLVEKKSLKGTVTKEYTTRLLNIDELTSMDIEAKEAVGLVVQEINISKLALHSV